jgi:hypothetical protein
MRNLDPKEYQRRQKHYLNFLQLQSQKMVKEQYELSMESNIKNMINYLEKREQSKDTIEKVKNRIKDFFTFENLFYGKNKEKEIVTKFGEYRN